MHRRMCRPAVDFQRRSPSWRIHAPSAHAVRVGQCQCRRTLLPKIGLGPERNALSCGRIRCLRNAIPDGTAPKRVRRTKEPRKDFAAGPPGAL